MATEAQIDRAFELMDRIRPNRIPSGLNQFQIGTGAVIRLLAERKQEVTAGMISKSLNVSTARVAALLNSLSEKRLIVRSRSKIDGRVVVVSLSDEGKRFADTMKRRLREALGSVVDQIGLDALESFVYNAGIILNTLRPPECDI